MKTLKLLQGVHCPAGQTAIERGGTFEVSDEMAANLQACHPGRFEEIRPVAVEIGNASEQDEKQAIALINALPGLEAIGEFVQGETRPAVLAAAQKRKDQFGK